MSRIITSALLVGLLTTVGWAQAASESAASRATETKSQKADTAAKRAWLRKQAVRGLTNQREIRAVQAHIDLIRPQQIDKLVNGILAQQLGQQADAQQTLAQLQLELAQVRLLRQMLEREYWLWRSGSGNVAYAPVVTWLPEGTSFGASAVISPDRRYVRTNVMPFFSSVGPVYSYNLNTGETRLLPQYNQPYYNYNPYPWPQLGYGNSNIVPMPTLPVPKEKLRGSLIWDRPR
jgi:hypothetical protein